MNKIAFSQLLSLTYPGEFASNEAPYFAANNGVTSKPGVSLTELVVESKVKNFKYKKLILSNFVIQNRSNKFFIPCKVK